MIIRVQKTANYVAINNEPLRDSTLSWAARGVLAYLLSQPDNWSANTENLVAQGPSGRFQILKILKELQLQGYLLRKKSKNTDGKWAWTSTILENPNKKPQCSFPPTGKPPLENRTTKEVPIKQEVPIIPLPPIPFKGNDFLTALAEFQEHRKSIKKPLTQIATKRLYADLAEWGELPSTEALHDAVRNGWQGVFRPKQNGFKTQAEMNQGGRGRPVVI